MLCQPYWHCSLAPSPLWLITSNRNLTHFKFKVQCFSLNFTRLLRAPPNSSSAACLATLSHAKKMQILLHAQSIFFVFMSRPGYVLHYDTNFPLCLPEVLRVSVSVCAKLCPEILTASKPHRILIRKNNHFPVWKSNVCVAMMQWKQWKDPTLVSNFLFWEAPGEIKTTRWSRGIAEQFAEPPSRVILVLHVYPSATLPRYVSNGPNSICCHITQFIVRIMPISPIPSRSIISQSGLHKRGLLAPPLDTHFIPDRPGRCRLELSK